MDRRQVGAARAVEPSRTNEPGSELADVCRVVGCFVVGSSCGWLRLVLAVNQSGSLSLRAQGALSFSIRLVLVRRVITSSISNRAVKPRTADGTAVTGGRVGRCHLLT